MFAVAQGMRGISSVPSFERLGPPVPLSPLVCAVPHAGRHYPPALVDAAACGLTALEELEDRHADLLIDHALDNGAVAIVARTARAWIDLNRGEEDLAPEMRHPRARMEPVSARARSGLGLIPSRIGRRELWRRAPTGAEAAARIATVHRPYHDAIALALAEARRRHGFAILLDCHSMPPLRGAQPQRVVVGDLHGRSAAGGLGLNLVRAAAHAGYHAALNAPYAGAYSLSRHGRPDDGVHAIQIEIDRSLYLAPDMRATGPGLDQARALIGALAMRAVDMMWLMHQSCPVAAE